MATRREHKLGEGWQDITDNGDGTTTTTDYNLDGLELRTATWDSDYRCLDVTYQPKGREVYGPVEG